MVARKRTKSGGKFSLHFWMAIYLKPTQLTKALNFPKNILILEAWKAMKDMNFRLDFFVNVPST